MSRWRLLAGLAGDRLWRVSVPACWRRCLVSAVGLRH